MGIKNNNLDPSYRTRIWVDNEFKSWLNIENDNFNNCSTSSFNRSEHINSRRTSPVPLNIDSLFHVRMTNSYFCTQSLSCAFGIMMPWKYAISPQFILVFPTKLHLWLYIWFLYVAYLWISIAIFKPPKQRRSPVAVPHRGHWHCQWPVVTGTHSDQWSLALTEQGNANCTVHAVPL